jgi:hypothetical protein
VGLYPVWGKAQNGHELFDVEKDPKQSVDLAKKKKYQPAVKAFQKKMAAKLAAVRDNDLGLR